MGPGTRDRRSGVREVISGIDGINPVRMALRARTSAGAAIIGTAFALSGCVSQSQHTILDESNSLTVDPASYDYLDLDGLSRLELAEIANNSITAAPVPLTRNISNDSVFIPAAVEHEASEDRIGQDRDSADIVRKASNFNTFSFSPERYQSVQSTLPPGWREVKNGLLHQNSGMVCIYGLSTEDEKFSMELDNIKRYDETSTDVGCNYKTNTGALVTIWSSKWPEISQAQHFAAADSAIRENFKITQSLPVTVAVTEGYDPELMGMPTAVGYEATVPNNLQKLKTSLWLVKTGNWHVKARATHYLQDGTTEIIAALLFSEAHKQVYDQNGNLAGVSSEFDV